MHAVFSYGTWDILSIQQLLGRTLICMQELRSWPGSNSCRPRKVHSKIHETTPVMEVVAGHGWRTTARKDSLGVCPPAAQATAVSTHRQLASNRSSMPPWSFKKWWFLSFGLASVWVHMGTMGLRNSCRKATPWSLAPLQTSTCVRRKLEPRMLFRQACRRDLRETAGVQIDIKSFRVKTI